MCRLLLKTNIEKNEEKLFECALGEMERGGPDASHILIEDEIAFGHNRLSIIDLTDMADQPMMIDGNIILFNGEIYNHKKLKEDYKLETQTDSDTEVILLLYNKFKEKAFSMLDGEFAIVIYDGELQEILAVRDRLGIKQLYFSDVDDLVISSEIKGILPFLGDPEMDTIAFDQWLCYGYPVSDYTMFNNVSKVLPNTIMRFDTDGSRLGSEELDMPSYDEETTKNASLAGSIIRSIGKRMMSDVPVSCTLSGGIDSSIVAFFMSKISKEPIKTYTIGFEGCDNEFKEAKEVADLIKSNHTEVHIPLSKVLEEIDEIVETMEEPIDRGSLIPTYFLGQAIEEKVTLIGEGSDEVFAGYSRHKWLMDHPNADFKEYFDENLRAFPSDEQPLMYDNWEDKNSALKFDLENEIPNFHTIRIDKCMMRNAVEARVPFLDVEVTGTLFETPFGQKQNPEKKVLRDAFRGVIPDWILDRPKKALKLPFEKLIKLPAVESLIKQESEHFDRAAINDLYANLDKNRHAARNLWNIFLFKKWEKRYLK